MLSPAAAFWPGGPACILGGVRLFSGSRDTCVPAVYLLSLSLFLELCASIYSECLAYHQAVKFESTTPRSCVNLQAMIIAHDANAHKPLQQRRLPGPGPHMMCYLSNCYDAHIALAPGRYPACFSPRVPRLMTGIPGGAPCPPGGPRGGVSCTRHTCGASPASLHSRASPAASNMTRREWWLARCFLHDTQLSVSDCAAVRIQGAVFVQTLASVLAQSQNLSYRVDLMRSHTSRKVIQKG